MVKQPVIVLMHLDCIFYPDIPTVIFRRDPAAEQARSGEFPIVREEILNPFTVIRMHHS
jgi:hypothetical protein